MFNVCSFEAWNRMFKFDYITRFLHFIWSLLYIESFHLWLWLYILKLWPPCSIWLSPKEKGITTSSSICCCIIDNRKTHKMDEARIAKRYSDGGRCVIQMKDTTSFYSLCPFIRSRSEPVSSQNWAWKHSCHFRLDWWFSLRIVPWHFCVINTSRWKHQWTKSNYAWY